MTTSQPRTVQVHITVTDDGHVDYDSQGSTPDVNALDQLRALMLGIFVLTEQVTGYKPTPDVIADLQKWADEVTG